MLLAVMALLLIPVSVQAAAKKPGTVKLSRIKATDYNKIKGKQSRKCLGTNSIIVRKGDPVVLADCDFSRALEFTIR